MAITIKNQPGTQKGVKSVPQKVLMSSKIHITKILPS